MCDSCAEIMGDTTNKYILTRNIEKEVLSPEMGCTASPIRDNDSQRAAGSL
jgi:hypothetical protein